MATAKQVVAKALAGYDSVSVFNAIRAKSPSLASRYPEATANTLKSIGYNLTRDNVDLKMEYLNGLLAMVSAVFVKSNAINNPLADMIVGGEYYAWGDLIEKIAVHVAKGVSPMYLTSNLGTGKTIDPFIQNQPNTVTEFYKSNLPFQYLVTISEWQLQRAFEGPQGMESLVAAILESVTNGMNLDLYIAGKNIINAYINDTTHVLADGQVIELPVPADEATGKNFVLNIKNIINEAQFPTTAFNPAGITQTGASGDFVMYAKPSVLNNLSVNVWASAFNRDDLDLTPVDGTGRMRIKTVDNFGGLIPKNSTGEVLTATYDGLGAVNGYQTTGGEAVAEADVVWDDPNKNVLAVIATPDAFRLALRKQNYAPIYNPRGEYTNYWYNSEYWAYYSNMEPVIIIKAAQ